MTTLATTPLIRSEAACAGAVLLTVKQVGELMGISTRSVWRLAAAGEIPRPLRITPKVVRWDLRTLEEFIVEKRRPLAWKVAL